MPNINAVIHFNKCSPGSTLASARIAKYIADRTGSLLIDESTRPFKTNKLFIVNSLFMFCNFRDEVIEFAKNTDYLIWVQNDYSISIPTKVKDWVHIIISNRYLDNSIYLNWNKLTFKDNLSPGKHDLDGLFYYGACRQGRRNYLSKYFNNDYYKQYISTTTKASKEYKKICKTPIIMMKPWTTFNQLQRFQFALYIEDKHNHNNYHSPANRFYEYLSAGLGILFDKSCKNTFDEAGYDIRDYIVNSPEDVKEFIPKYDEVVSAQLEWRRNYLKELDKDFDIIMSTIGG